MIQYRKLSALFTENRGRKVVIAVEPTRLANQHSIRALKLKFALHNDRSAKEVRSQSLERSIGSPLLVRELG